MIKFTRRLVERIYVAYNVVVLTGAGMSAQSRVPTFSGEKGLWQKFKSEEFGTKAAFLKQPELVWKWQIWRREIAQHARPHAGHFALAKMADYFPELTIVTQNTDGLHQKAGTKKITELHGNIFRYRCINKDCTVPAGVLQKVAIKNGLTPAKCPQCGHWICSGMLWTDEALSQEALAEAQAAAAAAEVFFAIGTSASIEEIAALAYLAKGNGAFVVEVNPAETSLSDIADEKMAVSAEEMLPMLFKAVEKLRKRSNSPSDKI